MIMFIIQKYPSWLLCSAMVVWLLHMPTLGYCLATGGATNATCIEAERRALLEFKRGIVISNKNLLSDWRAENMDCCRWERIKCGKDGRVVSLDLGPDNTQEYGFGYIRGEIGPSLLDLPYLEFLDLRYNMFYKIPAFIGSFKRLRYLKLSFNSFSGIIPPQLGNLSTLESFELTGNSGLEVDSLSWTSGLSSLEYLNMNFIDLSSTTDWFESITNLPSLTEVHLQQCRLRSPSTYQHVNSTKPLKLQILDIFYNELVSVKFLSNLISIKHLDLSYNNLEGEIPDSFSTNLTSLLSLNASENRLSNNSGFLQLGSISLQELRLDYNNLTGLLPHLSMFPSLRVVTVAHNKFEGHLVQFLENGFNVVELDVSSNSLDGVLREDNFIDLPELKVLDLSSNSIALNISTWWVPPFQLDAVILGSCTMGPGFPHWLRTQSNLTDLDISNSGVSEAIPSWFWNISSRLEYVNISHNRMSTKLPNYMPTSYTMVDLSFNQLYGALPSFSSELVVLDLSNNKFSGGISFLCSLKEGTLLYLGLNNNLLSGSLTTCWERVNSLELLNLNNNNFSGNLPHSMGNLRKIKLLSFRNNSLSGELPHSLVNCQGLFLLDLGENQLSGIIPTWIGTSLNGLIVLALHGNKFMGNIPRALCHLQSIQILDLSFNNISGMIPSCVNNFTSITTIETNSLSLGVIHIGKYGDFDYTDRYFTTWIAWKGSNHQFLNQNLELLTLIDLSNNRLSGPIPRELASLYKLRSLNLSRNSLTGIIPDNIGQLNILDSLDLSNNLLYGEIPRSMANMSFISYLDFSSNNLSGKIPSSTQLQGFDASVFDNNPMLCGPPTTNQCYGNRSMQDIPIDGTNPDHKSETGIFHEDVWLYISIGVGFIVGFWGVCGTLVLKDSWRQRYFEVLNNWKEGISVAILVTIFKLKGMLTS